MNIRNIISEYQNTYPKFPLRCNSLKQGFVHRPTHDKINMEKKRFVTNSSFHRSSFPLSEHWRKHPADLAAEVLYQSGVARQCRNEVKQTFASNRSPPIRRDGWIFSTWRRKVLGWLLEKVLRNPWTPWRKQLFVSAVLSNNPHKPNGFCSIIYIIGFFWIFQIFNHHLFLSITSTRISQYFK